MPTVAVVGASSNPDRYSHQAVVRYQEKGWTVYPVHPSGHAVAGQPCLRSLDELPERPDIISMYVNPRTGLSMLDAIVAQHPRLLWLNPGADDDTLEAAAQAAGLQVVSACNLVALSLGDPLSYLDR